MRQVPQLAASWAIIVHDVPCKRKGARAKAANRGAIILFRTVHAMGLCVPPLQCRRWYKKAWSPMAYRTATRVSVTRIFFDSDISFVAFPASRGAASISASTGVGKGSHFHWSKFYGFVIKSFAQHLHAINVSDSRARRGLRSIATSIWPLCTSYHICTNPPILKPQQRRPVDARANSPAGTSMAPRQRPGDERSHGTPARANPNRANARASTRAHYHLARASAVPRLPPGARRCLTGARRAAAESAVR